MSSSCGRPLGLLPPPSRNYKVECCVPGCSVSMRKDNLRQRHYSSLVQFLPDGDPMSDTDERYEALTEVQKTHTKYFFDNNISQSETPYAGYKRQAVPASVNPFTLAKKKRTEEPQIYNAEDTRDESAGASDRIDTVIHDYRKRQPCSAGVSANHFILFQKGLQRSEIMRVYVRTKMNQIPVAPPPPSGEGISLWPIYPLPSILLPFQRDPPDLN